jgi:hypothetical protein
LGIKPEEVVGLIGLSLVPKTRAAQRIAREQFAPQVPGASPTSEQLRDVRVTTESLRCPCRIDTSAISLETHVSEVEPTVSIQARENCSQWLENVPKDWQVRSKGARADF